MNKDNNKAESWRPVEDYEGLYEVSDLGRIWSIRSNKILKTALSPLGYVRIGLCKGGVSKGYYLHRLVAKAFLPPSEKPEINHKDGDKQNNIPANLEWCTRRENLEHAFNNGLAVSPLSWQEDTYTKLTEEDVKDIVKALRIVREATQAIKKEIMKGKIEELERLKKHHGKYFRDLHYTKAEYFYVVEEHELEQRIQALEKQLGEDK